MNSAGPNGANNIEALAYELNENTDVINVDVANATVDLRADAILKVTGSNAVSPTTGGTINKAVMNFFGGELL